MISFDVLIKRQIKLTILTVIAVILMSVTISYALYQSNHENTTNQVISIGSLGLTATGTPITLNGLYPMEEYDLTDSYPRYEFTLENKTDNTYNDYTLMYELVLTPTSQDFTSSDYQYIMYKIDEMKAQPLSEAWDDDINGYKILDGRLLSHDESLLDPSLNGKDSENHSIVFWLSTIAPNSMSGKSVNLSMTLSAYADRFNYLIYQPYTLNTNGNRFKSNILGKSISSDLFESITTLNIINVPPNAIDSWDVSQKQNGEIMAWYTDIDNNELYELYIGQEGGVIANPSCVALFQGYSNVTNINLSSFNTALVTTMYGMFYRTNDLNILDLSSFDTSNVISMGEMFGHCNNLETINLSSFNTEKVIHMGQMFYQCTSLASIDLSNFDTSNVTNMSYMFNGCRKIENLDLSNFTLKNVSNLSFMFDSIDNIKTLNILNMIPNSSMSYTRLFAQININATIITNECAKDFISARLLDVNRLNVITIVKPCIRVCYVKPEHTTNQVLGQNYSELDYIESTGTQYIDSGYKPSPNTGIYADFQFTDIVTTQQRLYGVTSDSGSNVISYDFYINGSNQFAYSYQDNVGNWRSTGKNIDAYRHIVSFNKNNDKKLYIDDGTTYSGSIIGSPTYTSPYNMYIMATYHNNNGAAAGYSKFKLYSFQIYESGTLVRNYVPVMRNSDNVLGLYETINNVFYENSGTGSFNSKQMENKQLVGDTMQIVGEIDAGAGYTFIGWNTKSDGTGTMFKQGEEVDASVLKSIGDEITLYAIWETN